jgi:hypothetical protein
MGIPRPFAPEKLVVAALAGSMGALGEAGRQLADAWGPVDFSSDPLPFTFTRYYEPEMGPGLLRQFFAFRDLGDPQGLAGIKLATNAIERRLARDGHRTVNLDPGFVSLSRLVLATTKDGAHRIPLRDGIYAEVTLVFERGHFRPVEWTYPDYRSEGYLAVLERIRTIYRQQVRL